jgi:hypothetical protein
MLKSSESFTWFLSSKRERERDARTWMNTKITYPL